MKKHLLVLSSLAMSLSVYTTAQAQNPTPEQAYNDAIQACTQLTDAAAKTNCRRDAGAALHQAKRTPPAQINPNILNQNRTLRCQSLPNASMQEDCVAQMSGQIQTEEFGSVAGGGILRKSIITTQGEPVVVEEITTTPPSIPAQSAPIR